MNMPDRPVFLCGKCEEICTEVIAANQPLQGRTVFEVKHHGRTYRKEIDQREIESICHSNVPALDVAGWPQDTTQNERASASGMFDRGFSEHDPLLYCGKCECRMEKRAAYLNQVNRSVDFAVCCHGDVYVLNLSEDERWRMAGHQGDNMAGRATALPQRLDVCDQHGKQYPHHPPIHPDAAALEGTKVSASGIIFDPSPPVPAYVPQTPDWPVVAALTADRENTYWNVHWQLAGTDAEKSHFHQFKIELLGIGEAAGVPTRETIWTALSDVNWYDIPYAKQFNGLGEQFPLVVRVAVEMHDGTLGHWTELQLPAEPPSGPWLETWEELQAGLDCTQAAVHGVDLKRRICGPHGTQETFLVNGKRVWWNERLQQYVSFRPAGAAETKAPEHTPDPATGLTPAATDALQQIAEHMIRQRRDGGPVTEPLKNMAPKLPPNVLDKLAMAADGTDLRKMITAFDGSLIKKQICDGTVYEWSLPHQQYLRVNAPKPVLATLPAPQVFHTTPTRRIILED